MKFLRGLVKFLPTFFTALIMAIIIWFSAVTASDPNEETVYPIPIPVSIVGLDPDMIIVTDVPDTLNLTILAPNSIQNRLLNDPGLIQASLNLSGLRAGTYTLTPQIDINVRPAEVKAILPASVSIKLESIITKEFPIDLNLVGSLPISYERGEPELSQDTVLITGAETKVNSVIKVSATVDLNNVTSDVIKSVDLKPTNEKGNLVLDLNLDPNTVQVNIPVKQLGGYRNVFVKIITSGQVASGFFLTNIVATPPNVTIYTADPELANKMPIFVETNPINLNGADGDFSVNVPLNLPDGISVVGEPTVLVEVGVTAIESSKNFLNVSIQVINLDPRYNVALSADRVDIYLSGPLYLLDELVLSEILVTLDLEGREIGTYQLVPQVTLENSEIKVDAILPGTIEVTISQ